MTPFEYMKVAHDLAQEAYEEGEVPVGCVFVLNDTIVATGKNETNKRLNGTCHAEIMAMKSMKDITQTKLMDLYVTIEPCIMCAAALRLAGIKHVYFGAKNDKFGGCGTVLSCHSEYNLVNGSENGHPPYEVTSGLMEPEAIMLLRKFYVRENDHGNSG